MIYLCFSFVWHEIKNSVQWLDLNYFTAKNIQWSCLQFLYGYLDVKTFASLMLLIWHWFVHNLEGFASLLVTTRHASLFISLEVLLATLLENTHSLYGIVRRFAPFASPTQKTWLSVVVTRWVHTDLFYLFLSSSFSLFLGFRGWVCIGCVVEKVSLSSITLAVLYIVTDMLRVWRRPSDVSHLPKPYPNENKALLGAKFAFVWICLPSVRIYLSSVDSNVRFTLFGI